VEPWKCLEPCFGELTMEGIDHADGDQLVWKRLVRAYHDCAQERIEFLDRCSDVGTVLNQALATVRERSVALIVLATLQVEGRMVALPGLGRVLRSNA
jgi:hypothetical protein